MNWELREGIYFCGPYRIVHGVRGWSVWYYDGASECLRREIRSLEAAKSIAADHKTAQAVWP